METNANPFAVLSLIGAPAILTNASSVLVMSTSNRLARTVDCARELARQLDAETDAGPTTPGGHLRLRELKAAETRSLLLLRALRLFYGALSGFASSAFVSLLGSVVIVSAPPVVARVIEFAAVIIGFLAVGSLVSGALLLIHETRIAVTILHEQTEQVQRKVHPDAPTPG